jgi:hypothetical protein
MLFAVERKKRACLHRAATDWSGLTTRPRICFVERFRAAQFVCLIAGDEQL